jgi:lipid II:glycine glycyltransferase (peptidoglycan interpeptide bridge formation enzyme)
MEANDPEALESLLVQLKQIVNSASSAQLWAKPPIIDSSYDENGDLIETQENDTPGLRQFKMSVSKEIEGIENVSQPPLGAVMYSFDPSSFRRIREAIPQHSLPTRLTSSRYGRNS